MAGSLVVVLVVKRAEVMAGGLVVVWGEERAGVMAVGLVSGALDL